MFNEGNGQSPQEYSDSPSFCTVKVIRSSVTQCPAIKNHTSVQYKNAIIIFGGYDSKRNHNDLHVFKDNQWQKVKASGRVPEGRNGHTATVVENKMYIIGGWLGSGTYASSDVYILDLDAFDWSQAPTLGEVPGPCNMHSADCVGQYIYVFRGGDGKDYLNDLHCLNTKTNFWKLVNAEGECPPPRANHSSAVIQSKLYIFGGWDGTKRLNDLFCYDVTQNRWQELRPFNPPSARAGMCMTTVDNKLYLFGGSGPQVTCYGDLQYYDPIKNAWQITELMDEDQSVKARAGHSMTSIGSLIYIFGGSCSQVYYKDFFIIDTDSAPEIKTIESEGPTIFAYFKNYYNNPKFCDITFQIQDELIYAHKIILCRYEMFSKLLEWNDQAVQHIIIKDVSAKVFSSLIYFIYTGEVSLNINQYQPECRSWNQDYVEQMLYLSDQYLIDEVKLQCEKLLQGMITTLSNLVHIRKIAHLCNARHLKKYTDWFQSHYKL